MCAHGWSGGGRQLAHAEGYIGASSLDGAGPGDRRLLLPPDSEPSKRVWERVGGHLGGEERCFCLGVPTSASASHVCVWHCASLCV